MNPAIAQVPRRATFAQVARTYHLAVLHFDAACRAYDRGLAAMDQTKRSFERVRELRPRPHIRRP